MPLPRRSWWNAPSVQIWADEISTSTSSPILVGDRVYVVSEKGDLCCVDANSGEVLWKLKIGIEERNSCPMFADGKLYVPMLDDPAAKTEGLVKPAPRARFTSSNPPTRTAKSSRTSRWMAAASARPRLTMARFTSRPRAIFIASAKRATIPACRPRRRRRNGPRPAPPRNCKSFPLKS